MRKSIKQNLKSLWERFLDIIFPQSETERRIRNSKKEVFFKLIKIEAIDEKTISVFEYRNDFIKEALWMLKYRRNMWLAKIFAEAMYEVLLEEIGDQILFNNFTKPILIPLPLSKTRAQERGFNQSELLAKEIYLIDEKENLSFEPKVLFKIKNTESQTHKNKKDRRENIKGSFEVRNSQKIKGRNIILIDDVYTTGSTLNEAGRVLRKSGAKKVFGLVVAH